MTQKIKIGGDEYIQIPQKKSKAYPPLMQAAMLMASAFTVYGEKQKAPRQRPYVDIVREFELIQLKKSKLSRSDRDWVEREFNRNFVKI